MVYPRRPYLEEVGLPVSGAIGPKVFGMDDIELMHYAMNKAMAEYREIRKYIKDLEAWIDLHHASNPEAMEQFLTIKAKYKGNTYVAPDSSKPEGY